MLLESEAWMIQEERENALGWGVSCGLHIIILMIVAATGLFQAVSSESHPLDVEIYDNVEENEEASDEAETAEASAPEPTPAAAVEEGAFDRNVKVPELEKEEKQKPQEEKQQTENKKSDASSEAKSNANSNPNSNANKAQAEGEHKANQGGPARDPAKVRRVKMRAQPLGGTQPSYPANLRAQNAAGSVTVSYVIEADGSVSNPQVQASSGYPEMDAAAINAISTFRYSPARNDYDEPVRSFGRYTFNFHP